MDSMYGRTGDETEDIAIPPYEILPGTKATFAQGTAQMALVHYRLGNDDTSAELIEFLLSLQGLDGSVPYVTPPLSELEMPDWPSAAGVNWLLLAFVDLPRFFGP